jgi:hypothetical protein
VACPPKVPFLLGGHVVDLLYVLDGVASKAHVRFGGRRLGHDVVDLRDVLDGVAFFTNGSFATACRVGHDVMDLLDLVERASL